MKAIFWIRPEHDRARSDWRETNLAEAIQNGAALCGDEVEIKDYTGKPQVEPCDLVLGIGVKRRDLFRAYNAAGISYAYFDKGYDRSRSKEPGVSGIPEWLNYWRVSVNAHQPLRYMEQVKHDSERADSMRLDLEPEWYANNKGRRYVMIDGSSAKHHYFEINEVMTDAQLMAYTDKLARSLVQRVRDQSPDRPIIFRYKPSFLNKRPQRIEGRAGGEPIQWSNGKDPLPDLSLCGCLVTYSSNLCLDAVLFGVPSVVLGDGAARQISSTSLEDLDKPYLASLHERRQWLNNIAWCQFKVAEFANGLGWLTIRDMSACSPL